MKRFDRFGRWRWPGRRLRIGAWLGLGAILASLPAGVADLGRDAWQAALRPAQQAAAIAADDGRELAARFQPPADVARLQQRIAELEAVNRRLQAELQLAARTDRDAHPSASADELRSTPLLQTSLLPARVLGWQAQTFLRGLPLVDVGRRHGAADGALVVDGPAATEESPTILLVDQGRDRHIAPGDCVLLGRRVWGKVLRVGPMTSTVQRANDAGFRDLVQLATVDQQRLRFGPQGVLVGVGQPLCRLERIDAAEPVAVGDAVYAADDGARSVPLLYGHIVRAEHMPGEAHWQLWVQLATEATMPSRLCVLRTELNPVRLAELRGEPR
jgi:hypothetical protein